jgi:hypothetical protein
VQFTSPHAYLSTATGLAFSARALGGAFGSAVLNTIINSKLTSEYVPSISSTALSFGLPSSSLPALLGGLASGNIEIGKIEGLTGEILGKVMETSHEMYAAAYRLAWASVVPFVVLALIAVCFIKGVKELMTEHVEATVEHESAQGSDSERGV